MVPEIVPKPSTYNPRGVADSMTYPVLRGQHLRSALWITAFLLALSTAFLVFYLLKPKQVAIPLPQMNVADLTGIVSLALNAALFVVTIISLLIAVAAYKAAESSGEKQQETLDASRTALQQTADTLRQSADHFRETAESSRGQYDLLQKEKTERENAVLATLIDELAFNAKAVTDNQAIIQAELAILKNRQYIIPPLHVLHTQAWELLRLYIPAALNSSHILKELTDSYRLAFAYNEVLRSREEYRLHNSAMTDFSEQMTIYDQSIQGSVPTLASAIANLQNALQSHK